MELNQCQIKDSGKKLRSILWGKILDNVGEDSQRGGLIGTPDRIARMFDEVLGGYKVDPVKLVNGA